MYQVKVYHKGRKKGQQFMGKHTNIKIESRNSDNFKKCICVIMVICQILLISTIQRKPTLRPKNPINSTCLTTQRLEG